MTASRPERQPESVPPSLGPIAPREILNFAEAAAFLGISTKTFQKVLREGDVPGRKVGREWKFSRHALTDWVGAGRSADFLDASDGAPEPKRGAARGRRGPTRRVRRRDDLSAEED